VVNHIYLDADQRPEIRQGSVLKSLMYRSSEGSEVFMTQICSCMKHILVREHILARTYSIHN